MHILYLCQYFPPEMGAPAARAYEFSRRWIRAGHRVTVVCGIPNHPTGRVYPGYGTPLMHAERIDGIDVIRAWVYVTPNAGTIRRSLNFLSFGASAVLASETVRDADVCIASSPQLFTGASGAAVRKLKHIPLVLEVRDLWPDSLEAVGVRVPQRVMRALRRMERAVYAAADRVVIVSPAFRPHLLRSGVPDRRIAVIPNGVSTDLFRRGNGRTAHQAEARCDDFLVGYIGTHGMAHGLETMIDAARILRTDPAIRFVLVGEGAEKRALMASAADLPSVRFVDRQPRETIAGMMQEFDVLLVLLRNSDLFKTVIPSKLFEIFGAGKPAIVGVDGETRRIVEDADAGIAIEPHNARALADAIIALKNDPARRERYGDNGYRYVREHYDLDALAERYLDVLAEAVRS